MIVVPFNDGNLSAKMKFQMQPDLKTHELPAVPKEIPHYLEIKGSKNGDHINTALRKVAA